MGLAYPTLERLAFATLTEAEITSNDALLLRNYPYRTYPYSWLMAYDRIATPYAWRETGLDGVDTGFGGITFEASFGLLNDAMLEYLLDQFPAGKLTANVTVYLYDRLPSAGWKAINAQMSMPELDASGLGGIHDVYYHEAKFRFFNGVIAAEE